MIHSATKYTRYLILTLTLFTLSACNTAALPDTQFELEPQVNANITGIAIISSSGDPTLGYNPIPNFTTFNLEGLTELPLDLRVNVSSGDVGSIGLTVTDAVNVTTVIYGPSNNQYENNAHYDFKWSPTVTSGGGQNSLMTMTAKLYSGSNGSGSVVDSYTLNFKAYGNGEKLRDDNYGPIDNPVLPVNYITASPGNNIQNKINAASSQGKGLVLTPGIYYNQSFTLTPGMVLVGQKGAILDGRPNSSTPASNIGARQGNAITGANNTVVRNLEIRYYGNEDVGEDQDQRSRPAINTNTTPGITNMLIEYNYIHDNLTSNVSLAGTDVVIRKNKLTDAGRYGANGYQGTRGVFENNEVARNNSEAHDPAFDAGGLKFSGAEDIMIRNNYVHDNYGTGLWADGFNRHMEFRGNLVIQNVNPVGYNGPDDAPDAHGIFFEISDYGVIVGNRVKGNNGAGIQVSESGSGEDEPNEPPNSVQVKDNFIFNNSVGIYVKSECRDGGRYVKNLTVEDNMIGTNSTSGSTNPSSVWEKFASVSVSNVVCSQWPSGVTATTIRNSISFISNDYKTGSPLVAITSGDFFYKSLPQSPIKTYAEWKAITGE